MQTITESVLIGYWRPFVSLLLCGFFVFSVCRNGMGQDYIADPDWSGIPGPYRAAEICLPTKDDVWVVGGYGFVKHWKLPKAAVVFDVRNSFGQPDEWLGVYATEAGRAWLVGGDGIIYFTKNGGKNWNQQESGTQFRLTAVSCVGDSNCWVVGGSGLILRTTDGGRKWARIYTGLWDDLNAVEFVNSKVGWAVGEEGLVLSTTDGGLSWTEHRVCLRCGLDEVKTYPSDLRAIRFVNENVGWVAGWDGIARTVDGGLNWEVTSLPDTAFVGLVSQDGKKLWAVNEGDNYCSNDAGEGWHICKPAPDSTESLLNGFSPPWIAPGRR